MMKQRCRVRAPHRYSTYGVGRITESGSVKVEAGRSVGRESFSAPLHGFCDFRWREWHAKGGNVKGGEGEGGCGDEGPS